MSKFPSNRVLVLTASAILIYLVFDFRIKGKRDFFQLNYDWNSKEILESIKNIKIDSVSYDFLKLDITNTTNNFKLNTDNSYSISNIHYFRCASIKEQEKKIIFSGVYWINSIPNNIDLNELEVLNLPIIQKGTKRICMIGDSQLTWLAGKYTRKNILKKVKNINFVGNHKDVFGYPYQSELLNNSKKIVENITELPKADVYILFIGAHEPHDTNTGDNINKIINVILKNKSELILIIPQSISKYLTDKHKIIKNTYLQYEAKSNVKIIDLSLIRSKPNLFLMNDKVHLNLFGHETLTKYLIDALKK